MLDIDELIKNVKIFSSASGLSIAIVDVRGMKLIGSLLAKKLQQKGVDVVFILYTDNSGVLYGDGKVNLLEIATKYNGGGHPNACGVNFKNGLLDKILSGVNKKHVPVQAKKLINELKEI